MHILRVCKKYGYSLDSLYLFLLMASQYGVLQVMISMFLKFQKRAVRFGFLKAVKTVLSLLVASDKGPLADILPPSKTRLLRNRGHSYVLPQIETERFKRSFINTEVSFKIYLIAYCNPELLFLKLIESFIICCSDNVHIFAEEGGIKRLPWARKISCFVQPEIEMYKFRLVYF